MGNEIAQEWSAVIAAPLLSLIAVLTVIGIVWAVLHFLYRHRIEGLRDELERERAEITRLRARATDTPMPRKRGSKAPLPAQHQDKVASHRPAVPPPSNERVFVPDDMTPTRLMALCAGKTALQAKAATSMYLGKWARIDGTIANIYDHSSGLYVSVEVPLSFSGHMTSATVWLHFPQDRERLEVMEGGAKISAVGQIDVLKELSMDFEYCELIDSPT